MASPRLAGWCVRLLTQRQVRAGATLLFDSDPESEERETRLKASAFLAALTTPLAAPPVHDAPPPSPIRGNPNALLRILVVDHQDSFVHTLVNYVRQSGAKVVTLRPHLARAALEKDTAPDLVLLSPGPGSPSDFQLNATLDILVRKRIPTFGVCLGLQGMVEYFGGKLGVLGTPVHGKPSVVHCRDEGWGIWSGIPSTFTAGRYHSLFADRSVLPDSLLVHCWESVGRVTHCDR